MKTQSGKNQKDKTKIENADKRHEIDVLKEALKIYKKRFPEVVEEEKANPIVDFELKMLIKLLEENI